MLSLFTHHALLLAALSQSPGQASVPENVYQGELVSYPGPWNFTIPRSCIILVTDEELEALSDPDKVMDLRLTHEPNPQSLRKICEEAQASGQRTLILSFDHFFAQYRPGQEGKPREFTPDKQAFIDRVAAISKFCEGYGIGLELSLLTPLEIGPGYVAETHGSGMWMHYRKGLRDPKSGAYSVQMWQQRRWANNKGPIDVADAGVRVFAFKERPVGGTPYRVVNPQDIVEITETAQKETWADTVHKAGDFEAVRVRVYGGGKTEVGPLDRVLVVQQYRTPEMDYFSDQALPYLKKLTDRYVASGIKLNALYSDEMHIQQDWAYFNHHDHGEFALRYVSDGLAQEFSKRYGEEYRDFARYLVYFVHGQEDSAGDLSAKQDVQHVFGDSPESIRATSLFRARYYQLLQNGVVDLFGAAKRHLESKVGYRLEARAHATWAESPTIDKWDVGQESHQANQYEYTSNFVWSDTVHQAASACHDYFKWGDFLTGNGNDHAEGGWLDRDYFGLALGCSTGILNDVPYSYAAHWGMPQAISHRRQQLVNAFGASAWTPYAMVQGMVHRDVNVLILYPLDLVAVDERFGSWMTQYGYANFITQEKLIERGQVVSGGFEVAGRRFSTLVTLFEPFPAPGFIDMMNRFVEAGGTLVWSGPPPLLQRDNTPCLEAWETLAGVDYSPSVTEGVMAPGKQVVFQGLFSALPPMTILTDFLVDRIYPLTPRPGTATVASVKKRSVGTIRNIEKGGSVTCLGFRPRDDQSGSLGYEERHLFEILSALGAYPGSGRFEGINDNPEFLSRTSDLLCCRFPNGAVAVAPHLRDLEECWPGGFARNKEEDEKILQGLSLPSDHMSLKEFKVDGHEVSYEGDGCVTFRMDAQKNLVAFCGAGCREIRVDGENIDFADHSMPVVSWAPVDETRRVAGGAAMEILCAGEGVVRIPGKGLPKEVDLVAQGPKPGSRGENVPCTLDQGTLVFTMTPGLNHRWMFVVPKGGKRPEAGD